MAGSEAPALRKPPATATPNPPTVTAPVADSTPICNRPLHALHADFAKRINVGEVVETPWGMDELYVYDPSGSLVKFGQRTDRLIQADTMQEVPSA